MGYRSQVRRSAQSERKRSGKVIVRQCSASDGQRLPYEEGDYNGRRRRRGLAIQMQRLQGNSDDVSKMQRQLGYGSACHKEASQKAGQAGERQYKQANTRARLKGSCATFGLSQAQPLTPSSTTSHLFDYSRGLLRLKKLHPGKEWKAALI